MGFDKGYLKEYEKCSRCTSVHEDVFVSSDGCSSCRGKSDSEAKAIAARLKKEATASKNRHEKWRRHKAIIEAYDAAADNEFLELASGTPKNPLCQKCQADRKHRQRCTPCRDKVRAILYGKKH